MFFFCHFFTWIIHTAVAFSLIENPGSEYLFPFEKPARITGSFAENRGLHFHAGLDFSTGGKEGLPVRAGADGSVYRLRVSPFGYGKAVYIKFADGCFAVYGHLQKFSPNLKKIARKEQLDHSNYSVDCYFTPNQIRVKKGEVIGFSGSSGARFPHLHFELRDSQERPLNLLTHGLTVEDTIAPVFEGVAVRPRDAFSGVNATKEVCILKGSNLEQASPVLVWGNIGLEVAAVDPSGDNRLGVWRAELWLDGKLIFVNQYERFSYDHYRQSTLIYDRELTLSGLKDYQRLYRLRGDELPFHPLGKDCSGILQSLEADKPNYLKPGDHTARIVIRDAKGLFDEVDLTLRVQEPEVWNIPRWIKSELEGRDSPQLMLAFGDTYVIPYVYAPGYSPENVSLLYRDAAGVSREIPLLKTSGDFYLGEVELTMRSKGKEVLILSLSREREEKSEIIKSFAVQPVSPATGGRVVSRDGRARADFKEGEVYALVFPRVRIEPLPQLPGLRSFSPAYVFEPVSLTFKKKVHISIQLPLDRGEEKISRVGLYLLDNSGITYLGNDRDAGDGWISASSLTFGKFSLLEDSIPPEIEFPFPAGKLFASARPELIARVKDEGSGLEYSDLKMELDGIKVIAEYVPYQNLIRYRPPEGLSPGRHILTVSTADKMGNKRLEKREFQISTGSL